MRRQVQSEIASFESVNLPSDLNESCESPIPPPSDDSSDSDSYVEDASENSSGHGMRNGPTMTYGTQPTYSEKPKETYIEKEMSDLLNQVRGLTYQGNRTSQSSTLRQETEHNGRNPMKSVTDIAGAWMDRDSREWRGNN